MTTQPWTESDLNRMGDDRLGIWLGWVRLFASAGFDSCKSQWSEVCMGVSAETTIGRPGLLDLSRVTLNGNLSLPADWRGLVIFAHGSVSSRHGPRNRAVAAEQRGNGREP